jgi:hypothetical protein
MSCTHLVITLHIIPYHHISVLSRHFSFLPTVMLEMQSSTVRRICHQCGAWRTPTTTLPTWITAATATSTTRTTVVSQSSTLTRTIPTSHKRWYHNNSTILRASPTSTWQRSKWSSLTQQINQIHHRYTSNTPSSSNNSSNNDNTGAAVSHASNDAFAALERRLSLSRTTDDSTNTPPPSPSPTPTVAVDDKGELKMPVEPGPEECCGNDCRNCVWITYANELTAYEQYALHSTHFITSILTFDNIILIGLWLNEKNGGDNKRNNLQRHGHSCLKYLACCLILLIELN